MRLVLLSDTHECHREVDVPNGDVLIHAGDVTVHSRDPWVLEDFNHWLGELPHRHKLVVPGNHDFLFREECHRKTITNALLLIGSGVRIGGLNFWGSPVDFYRDSAFGIPGVRRAVHWAKMPRDLHVLITHIPPEGILDRRSPNEDGSGDPWLMREVLKKKPGLHVFGHQHSAFGRDESEHTLFANVAMPNEHFEMLRQPIVVDVSA